MKLRPLSNVTCASQSVLNSDKDSINCPEAACDDPTCCHIPAKCDGGSGGHVCASGYLLVCATDIDCIDGVCSDAKCCCNPLKCSAWDACSAGKGLKDTASLAPTSTDGALLQMPRSHILVLRPPLSMRCRRHLSVVSIPLWPGRPVSVPGRHMLVPTTGFVFKEL